MASPRRRSRGSSEIPLLIQRITPRLEPHQLQGRIVLTSGVAYEIGLDESVDERGGRAGFGVAVSAHRRRHEEEATPSRGSAAAAAARRARGGVGAAGPAAGAEVTTRTVGPKHRDQDVWWCSLTVVKLYYYYY